MKKLLLLFSLCAFNGIFAQDIAFTEDCTALTVGNLGTSTLGAIAGQHNWFTTVSTLAVPAGANTDFQVVNFDATHGNVIEINGSAAAATSSTSQSRLMFQDISSAWTNRTSGNDITELEYDFYTGPTTTSLDTFRTYIYDANNNAVAGFYYVPATNVIEGWAYYDNTATSGGVVGYYTFQLGSSADVVLLPSTWYRLGVAYDYNTGAITWKESTGLFYGGTTSADSGVDITKFSFSVNSATGNTLAAQDLIDNISVKFVATESLLSTKTNMLVANSFSVYPNPTKDLINISNDGASINTIEISDLNGRVVKTVSVADSTNVQVTTSDLSIGVYMMKIVSDKGTTTKKIIKE